MDAPSSQSCKLPAETKKYLAISSPVCVSFTGINYISNPDQLNFLEKKDFADQFRFK
jgi:hypothetical protein